MELKSKFSKKQIIIASVLAALAIIAVVVAIVVSNGNEVPAISNQTGDTTNAQTTAIQTSGSPETTTSQADTTITPETESPTPAVIRDFNPLTGEKCSEELAMMRPAAFMVNNIKEAMPQQGISGADVIYECLAEGGITRLLMLAQDYTKLGVVGSIRSSRDYYLDFAQNHDALYFHAGGSDKAYYEIGARSIDNFDGVNGSVTGMFYRDSWRLARMAKEHTLVISADGIQKAIAAKNARTELKEGFESPFNFYKEVTAPVGEDATNVKLPFSYYQAPQLKYDSTTNTYKRYQYGKAHIDHNNGEQLEFTNILVIFCHHTGALDSKGRIEVTTTGTGEGYYISNGKYINIKYTKDDVDSPIKLYNTDDTPLQINVGKTYIAIFNQSLKGDITLN